MDVHNLFRQHQEVLELVHKISSYQEPQEVRAKAFEISLLLGQLSGKIKVHLSAEDQYVYPVLMKHADAKIRSISESFAREMGDLAQAFGEYKTKYLGASRIADQTEAFLADTKRIFSALGERIERENRSLYTLLKQ